MSNELFFESRLSYLVLRQEGAVEVAPVILLQLELLGGPKIYASDASVIYSAVWSMTIRRHSATPSLPAETSGLVRYALADGKSTCMIDVHQSPERFSALMNMFKGGHASEITVLVDDWASMADYSKKWDTTEQATLTVKSICFEFPLPQSEG